MKELFGTDGIRGTFGEPPLDRATVVALGRALARAGQEQGRPTILAAGDTRGSTPALAGWLAEGVGHEGALFLWGGVLPTAAVACLAASREAAYGVAISASHNPAPDNGLKVIGGDGYKLPDALEIELERRIEGLLGAGASSTPPPPVDLRADATMELEYRQRLLATLDERPLRGLRIALDLANGAAFRVAPQVFADAGAEVVPLFGEPNGSNINEDCGSTRPEALARWMVEQQSVRADHAGQAVDLGLAFDGDADRVVAIDETGTVRDGDAILFAWGTAMHRRGELEPPCLVATSMSNLGLERALGERGIGVVRCDVGDRYVMETLRRENLRLGGEQSGHIVRIDLSTTGDGILTGLHLAQAIAASAAPASHAFAGFRRYPQRLHNLRVTRKPPLTELTHVSRVAAEIEEQLGTDGRLVLRYSGTEPLARIMIEAGELEHIDRLVDRLVSAFRADSLLETE